MALLAAALAPVQAGTFTANFNSAAPPAGLTLFDPAKLVATGGVGGSGYLSLTDAIGSQNSGAIINDLNNGQPIGGFTARMKILIGGGGSQPADGFSLSFGDDLPDGAISEEGAGNGLRVVMDTYDNGGGEAPAMDIYYAGNVIAHTKFDGVTALTTPPILDPATGRAASLQSDTNFVDLIIDLHPNGTLDVVYKGIVVYTNLVVTGYTPQAGRFGLGARTGGAVENHWIDDLTITTVAPITSAASVKIQPTSRSVNEGQSTTFTVVPDGAPPFTFQWLRNDVTIAGATDNSYTITKVLFSDNGAKYKARVTNAGGSASSTDAVLTVNGDSTKPTIAGVRGSDTFTEATVTFSEPVTAATAGDRANYALDGGLTISAVTVVNSTTVRLTTSRQTVGSTYKLTVNNVKDTSTAANAILPNSAQSFVAFVTLKGGLKFEAFFDISGAAIQALLDDPKFQANTPDLVAYTTQFTSRLVFADSAHENYGGRISGWLVPTETAQYEFFIRSDDASQLFLSPDDNVANAAQIAEETGCCNPFGDPGAAQTSAPVSLTAGKRYYIYAIWKEGGGGDYCDVAWRKVGDTAQARTLPYIQGNVLEAYATPGTFTPPIVAIATPVGGSTFDVGAPVTVTVTATPASGKTITKVEYLESGKVIADSSISPFSVTLPKLTEDAHVITARATDSAGLFFESAPISFAVGGQREKITLLAIDDKTTWRYDRSGQDLGTAWRGKNFDDSKWPQGKALIADESTTTVEPIRTPISRFNDANEYVRTFYFRTKFNFTSAVSPGIKLQLRHAVDDGAVFYLNGTEISRFGIAAGVTVDYLTDASGHENAWEGPFDIPATLLVQGENIFSVEVHQSGGGSSDMVFGTELVATVPVTTTVATLVAIDDKTTWRYDRTGQDLGTAWKEKIFDDSKWPQGKTLIADESTTTVEPIRTPISRFNDAGEYVRTFYFRTHFTFPGASTAGAKLKLRHAVDDGAVFYLNGVEISRFGIAAGVAVNYLTDASGHENAWEGPFDIPITNLLPGDNVLAVEVHQSGGSSSDMVFGTELVATIIGGGTPTPTAAKITKIAKNADGSITIEWTGGGTLQAGTAVTGPWQDVAGGTSPYTFKPTTAALFGRIKN